MRAGGAAERAHARTGKRMYAARLTGPACAQEVARQLQLSERMLALACAVSIDFDYFSRHSQTGAGGMLPFFMPIPMPMPPYGPRLAPSCSHELIEAGFGSGTATSSALPSGAQLEGLQSCLATAACTCRAAAEPPAAVRAQHWHRRGGQRVRSSLQLRAPPWAGVWAGSVRGCISHPEGPAGRRAARGCRYPDGGGAEGAPDAAGAAAGGAASEDAGPSTGFEDRDRDAGFGGPDPDRSASLLPACMAMSGRWLAVQGLCPQAWRLL